MDNFYDWIIASETYTIKLADDTEIEDLKLNGNNFVSDSEIEESMFDGNLSEVTITKHVKRHNTRTEAEEDIDTEETYENMELIQITQMGDEYWFILREIPEGELKDIKVRSDIDYIAMMTDVELD